MNTINMADGRQLVADPSQARCITTLAMHLCITGSPGTGKTSTLIAKCAFHISSGVRPSSVILVGSSSQMVQMIKTSLFTLVGSRAHKVWCGTFYELAFQIMRKYKYQHMVVPLLSPMIHKNTPSSLDELLYAWLAFLRSGSAECDRLLADIQYFMVDDGHKCTGVVQEAIMLAFASHGTHVVVVGSAIHSAFTERDSASGLGSVVDRFDKLFEEGRWDRLHTNHRNSLPISVFCEAVIQYNGSCVPSDTLHMACIIQAMRTGSQCHASSQCTRARATPPIIIPVAGGQPIVHRFATFVNEVQFIVEWVLTQAAKSGSVAILTPGPRECELVKQALHRRKVGYIDIVEASVASSFLKKPHVRTVLCFLNLCLANLPSKDVVVALLRIMSRADSQATFIALWDGLTHDMAHGTGSFIEHFFKQDPCNLSDGLVQLQLELEPIRHVLKAIHADTTANGLYVAYCDYIVSSVRSVLLPRIHYSYRQNTAVDLTRDVELVLALLRRFESYADFSISIALDEWNNSAAGVTPPSDVFRMGSLSIGIISDSHGLEFDSVLLVGCCDSSGCVTGSVATAATNDKARRPTPSIATPSTVENERYLFYLACSCARSELVLTYSESGGPLLWAPSGDMDMGAPRPRRRLSRFVRPALHYAITHHCESTAAIGTTTRADTVETSVDDRIHQVISTFGGTNMLFAALKQQFRLVPIFTGLGAAPPLSSLPVLTRGECELREIIHHIVYTCLTTKGMSWKDVVQGVIVNRKSHWKLRMIAKHIQQQPLHGTTRSSASLIDGTTPSWTSFFDKLENTCQHLTAGLQTPVTQLCSSKIGPLCLGQTLMVITVSQHGISGAELAKLVMYADEINMINTITTLGRDKDNTHTSITILASLDCMRGQLLQTPWKKYDAVC